MDDSPVLADDSSAVLGSILNRVVDAAVMTALASLSLTCGRELFR
jgi:hypothetical protein